MSLLLPTWIPLLGFIIRGLCEAADFQGPNFRHEPPSFVDFSNTTGTWIDCTAHGVPQPVVKWALADGTAIVNITGLRQIFQNGTLHFLPFRAEDYRPDIHAVTYKCFASNPSGVVVSREVKIRAVVLQIYEVQVYDEYIIRGNTAVMKCHIPSFVKDYVGVTSWVQDRDYSKEVPIVNERRFLTMATGELYIFDVRSSDAHSYRCRTSHRLTGETRLSGTSPQGKLFVTEPRGSVTPRITDSKPSVSAQQGESTMLPCAAQGYPVPTYSWSTKLPEGDLIPLSLNDRVQQISGVLLITNVQILDGGTYVCEASNSMGGVRVETVLFVTAPLSAHVFPQRQTVDLGQSATLNCVVSGHPVTNVGWVKDGRPRTQDSIDHVTPDVVLRINSVQKHDRGMYQCFVSNDIEVSQGTSELRLGDAPPEFQSTFIERTLHPGSPIFLQCVVSGNPTPEITWALDNMKVPENQRYSRTEYTDTRGDVYSHVNVSSARVEDGGEYSCKASNRAGKVEHNARINVYGDPYIRLPSHVSVVSSKTLTVRCHVAGYPIETISWERDGRTLPANHRQKVLPDGTLIIENIERLPDGGRYTCVARNPTGRSDRRDLEVFVQAPPKITPFSFQDEHLREGARARIQCVVSEGDVPIVMTWLKDGRTIVPNSDISIRDLDEYSSMLTVSAVTSQHNGNYTCVASNHAASVNYSTELSVNVPPKIMPFQDVQLNEGMRAQITCAIAEGDPPFRIEWLKDGHPIPPSLVVNVHNFDEYASSLSIDKVLPKHGGNYTCLASNNAAAEARYTVQLLVNVPPRFILPPQDSYVLLGGTIIMNCVADGFPKPTVRWMKAKGDSPGDYREISGSSSHIHQFENGSLQAINARQSDKGYYLCKASNGIGAGLSEVVFLNVHVPAHFLTKHRNVTVKVGESAHILCEALGDKPLMITWKTKRHHLHPEISPRYQLKEDEWENGVTSRLVIITAERQDGGQYTCVVQNAYGYDESHVNLTVQDYPSPPTNLKVVDQSSRSIQLLWTEPYSGNSDIIRYIIQYMPSAGNWHTDSRNVTAVGSDTQYTVSNLNPATRYKFRIYGINAVGIGQPSDVITVLTTMEAPGGAPEDIRLEATDPRTLKVIWKPPKRELWNGDITAYNVGYRIFDSSDPYTFKNVKSPLEVDGSEEMQLSLHNLKKYTKYGVIVQAVNNLGAGPKSEEVVNRTLEDVPNKPPENVRCSALSSQSLLVSWEPPPQSGINGLLKGYKVLYAPAEQWYNGVEAATIITSAWKDIIHGLDRYKNYSIQISAFTRVGDGVRSRPIYCQTQEDVPDAPAEVKALTMSPDSILVVWKSPQNANGLVTKYTLYSRNVDSGLEEITKHIVSSEYTLYEVRNLREGRRYEFWVTASTSIGEGQSTKVVAQSPGTNVPARIAGFDDHIISRWRDNVALSCRTVGIPTPTREWRFLEQPLHKSERVFWESNGTLQILDVKSTEAGNYTCRVHNIYGSDKLSYTLLVQAPPGLPTLIIGTTTFTSISVQWKPGSDGGGPIEEYILHYKRDFGEWEDTHLNPKLESYSLDDLWCGTRYQLYMTARNRIGVGEASEVKTVRTKGSAPVTPTKEKLMKENSTFITLNLASWGDGGCPILYFVIEYKPRNRQDWMLVSNNVKMQRELYAILDLQPHVWYNLRVTAHNSAGSTVAEYEFVTQAVMYGGPTAPGVEIYSKDEGSGNYVGVSVLFPIVAFIIVIITAIVAFYCYQKRRWVPTRKPGGSNEIGTHYEARFVTGGDKKPTVVQSDFDKGSFTCLLVNVDGNDASKSNTSRNAKPGTSRDEVQPYATYQLPPDCKTDNFTADDWKKYEVYTSSHQGSDRVVGGSGSGSGSGNIYPMLKKEDGPGGPDSSLSDDQEYASPVRSSDTSDSTSGCCQVHDKDLMQSHRTHRPTIEKARKPGRRAKVPDLIYRRQQECCGKPSTPMTPPGESDEDTLTKNKPLKIPRPQLEKPSAPSAPPENTIDSTFSFLDNMGSSQESSDTPRKDENNSEKHSSRDSSST